MLEFVVTNWMIFVIIAVVLLLGLFGYIMDRKKYNDYREEILSENGITPVHTQDVQDVQEDAEQEQ